MSQRARELELEQGSYREIDSYNARARATIGARGKARKLELESERSFLNLFLYEKILFIKFRNMFLFCLNLFLLEKYCC